MSLVNPFCLLLPAVTEHVLLNLPSVSFQAIEDAGLQSIRTHEDDEDDDEMALGSEAEGGEHDTVESEAFKF